MTLTGAAATRAQALAAHKHLATTMRYLHLSSNEAESAIVCVIRTAKIVFERQDSR